MLLLQKEREHISSGFLVRRALGKSLLLGWSRTLFLVETAKACFVDVLLGNQPMNKRDGLMTIHVRVAQGVVVVTLTVVVNKCVVGSDARFGLLYDVHEELVRLRSSVLHHDCRLGCCRCTMVGLLKLCAW